MLQLAKALPAKDPALESRRHTGSSRLQLPGLCALIANHHEALLDQPNVQIYEAAKEIAKER